MDAEEMINYIGPTTIIPIVNTTDTTVSEQ